MRGSNSDGFPLNHPRYPLNILFTDHLTVKKKNLAKKFPGVVERMNQEFTVWATSVQADEKKVLEKYHSSKTKTKKSK